MEQRGMHAASPLQEAGRSQSTLCPVPNSTFARVPPGLGGGLRLHRKLRSCLFPRQHRTGLGCASGLVIAPFVHVLHCARVRPMSRTEPLLLLPAHPPGWKRLVRTADHAARSAAMWPNARKHLSISEQATATLAAAPRARELPLGKRYRRS